MSDHQCPWIGGLATCPNHPKWHVIVFVDDIWRAYAPCTDVPAAGFHSWQEAFDYAYTHATGAAQ